MALGDPTKADSDRQTVKNNPSPDDDLETLAAPSHYEQQAENDYEFFTGSGPPTMPFPLGKYVLNEKVGAGGAGIVYKAVSNDDQRVVAVKILHPNLMASSVAVRRFAKESRLHAEIDSPYVTRHLEFGTHLGMHYMVSEFVDGISLREIANRFKKLPHRLALEIIRDVLRALDALHSKGVMHRDVKPENVLAIFDPFDRDDVCLDHYKQTKLTDFGLARHLEQSESLALTQQKAILGTPLYMAPEQHSESRTVDARADVYGVGATLYHLISGEPPFDAADFMALARLHREERPVFLSKLDPSIGEAVGNVVAKALEKVPDHRYRNAGEMLLDVERILQGKPISIRQYPATPPAGQKEVRRFSFEWELDATVASLWPLVADTDRFNRAIGLPAPEFSFESTGNERRMVAQANFNGMSVRWQEHPFQWIRHRSLSVLREFASGPFQWVTSTVELAPLVDGRTRLTHCFQVKPRGLFGRVFTPIQFGLLTKRSLNRVYHRLQSLARDTACNYACEAPFDKPLTMSRRQSERLNALSDLLATLCGVSLAGDFARYLGTVSDPTAARIRPFALAKDLGCSLEQSLSLCMHAVPIGLLNLRWDIICPVCRIASSNVNALKRIESHANCAYCELEFEVDFSRSVELIFTVHPEVRKVDMGVYCIGGPFHSPHVIAQNQLKVGEKVDIGTRLQAGVYQVRGPQLDSIWEIQVKSNAVVTRTDIRLGNPVQPLADLIEGPVCICLENNSDTEVLTRLEQSSHRKEAITAAQAIRHPLFQKLFPDEAIQPQHLVEKSNMNLIAIWDAESDLTLDEVGEIKMRANWNLIQKAMAGEAPDPIGDVIESSHNHLIIVFEQLSDLASSLMTFYQTFSQHPEVHLERFSCAIHRGELMMGNQPGQSRYFGAPLREIKNEMEQMKSEQAIMSIHKQQIEAKELRSVIGGLTHGIEANVAEDDPFYQLKIKPV